jgi:hypothetical protein
MESTFRYGKSFVGPEVCVVDRQSPQQARAALRHVDLQRDALADRIRIPPWYAVIYAAALIGLFTVPGLSVRPDHELARSTVVAVIVLGVVALGLLDAAVGRSAGARLRRDRTHAYASTRTPILMTGFAVLGGSIVTWALAETGAWVLSILCGLGIAVVALLGQYWQFRGIRHDIRAGRVAPR